MGRRILSGAQDFSMYREGGFFYVDKTSFICDWWQNDLDSSAASLLLRLRRFGKTMLLSMLEQFFSTRHANYNDTACSFQDMSLKIQEYVENFTVTD